MNFTPTQRATMIHMRFHNGIAYHEDNDRTMLSLQKRRLVEWCSRVGRKYGRSHWRLTTEGDQQVRKWTTP